MWVIESEEPACVLSPLCHHEHNPTDVYFEKASEEGGSAEEVPVPVTRVSFEN